MDRRETSQNRTERRRGSGLILFCVVAALLLGSGFQLYRMGSQVAAAREEERFYAARLDALEERNDRLRNEIENSDDPQLLESMARDDLGMAAPGEKIFRFN